MILKLQGVFSYIDKYNRLKFVFLDDDDSRDKLQRLDIEGHSPFTRTEFTVSMPAKHPISADIRALVGRRVAVAVNVKKYAFAGSARGSDGVSDMATGTKLVLDNIELQK